MDKIEQHTHTGQSLCLYCLCIIVSRYRHVLGVSEEKCVPSSDVEKSWKFDTNKWSHLVRNVWYKNIKKVKDVYSKHFIHLTF